MNFLNSSILEFVLGLIGGELAGSGGGREEGGGRGEDKGSGGS